MRLNKTSLFYLGSIIHFAIGAVTSNLKGLSGLYHENVVTGKIDLSDEKLQEIINQVNSDLHLSALALLNPTERPNYFANGEDVQDAPLSDEQVQEFARQTLHRARTFVTVSLPDHGGYKTERGYRHIEAFDGLLKVPIELSLKDEKSPLELSRLTTPDLLEIDPRDVYHEFTHSISNKIKMVLPEESTPMEKMDELDGLVKHLSDTLKPGTDLLQPTVSEDLIIKWSIS